MAKEQKVSGVFLGEDKILRFTITEDDDVTPVPITGWDLAWVVRQRPGMGTQGSGEIIYIENGPNLAITDGPNGVLEIYLARNFTLGLPPGGYHHTLWRTDPSNEQVLSYGTMEMGNPSQNQTP